MPHDLPCSVRDAHAVCSLQQHQRCSGSVRDAQAASEMHRQRQRCQAASEMPGSARHDLPAALEMHKLYAVCSSSSNAVVMQ
jgi:hypothetical protein